MVEYRVYTIKLAKYLTNKGFRFTRTAQDLKKPEFLNWFFENTPELAAAIDDYKAENYGLLK